MYGLAQRLINPFGRFNDYIAPLGEPQYTDENVSIVDLNTARDWQAKTDWSLGAVNKEDLETSIDNLKMTPSATFQMLALHHPFIYPPSSPLQKETKNDICALNRLSESNIDVVLSGHVHMPFLLQRQPNATDIMSIDAGTLSTRRRNRSTSFNHLIVDDVQISKTEINWDVEHFSKTALHEKECFHVKIPAISLSFQIGQSMSDRRFIIGFLNNRSVFKTRGYVCRRAVTCRKSEGNSLLY